MTSAFLAQFFVVGDHEEYVTQRRMHRVLGSALTFGFLLPPLNARLLRVERIRQLRRPIREWYFTTRPWIAAWLGALGGALEDTHTRWAWRDALENKSTIEPPLWTVRANCPVFSFVVHPLLAYKCLDGEIKGCDAALGLLERRPLQIWPFFAVLDTTRPSDPSFGATFRAIEWSSIDLSQSNTPPAQTWMNLRLLVHMAGCRFVFGGYYEPERNPVNWWYWVWPGNWQGR